MKRLLFALIVLITWSWTTTPDTVQVTVQLTGCEQEDSLFLFEFNGLGFRKLSSAPVNDSRASLEMPGSEPRIYYLGLSPQNVQPIILGPEESITVNANCRSFRSATVSDSPINAAYADVKKRMGEMKSRSGTLAQQYRQLAREPEAQEKVLTQMEKLDQAKMSYLDSLQENAPWLANVMALNTYPFYPLNQGDYPGEIPYFAQEYFQFVDWNDAALDYNPWVYESWKAYAETLSRIGIGAEQHLAYVQSSLEQIPTDRRSRQLAFGGALAAMQQTKHPNYVAIGEQFLAEYGEKLPEQAAYISEQIQLMRATSIGGEAPDFTQETPEGEMLSLNDLRGQVVLVDFWASWCGPCRRENPNVLKAYEQYHEQGFEVLGVSLDRDRNKWLKAIEADGLVWKHVSDLKGWSNEVAKLYGVRSIPHTLLLDREGRILATNLRGNALEAKLAEVFAE